MRNLCLLVLVACASQSASSKDAAPAAAPATATAPAPASQPPPKPAPAPPAAGPETAAEAAAHAAATPDPDDSCDTDADCAFTRVGPGEKACCPMLCTPRVVAKKRAQALEARIATCAGGHACPDPACRPPLRQEAPACVEHKCVGKPRGAIPD